MGIYYEDESVRLYLGDSAEVIPELTGTVDMVLTDPPYGMGKFATDGVDWKDAAIPILEMSFDRLVTGGSLLFFMNPAEVIPVGRAFSRPFRRSRVLWYTKPASKRAFPLRGWMMVSEAILWYEKIGKSNLRIPGNYSHDVYTNRRLGREEIGGHPTVKPLWVVRDIAQRCPAGGTILDPFAGTGTTLFAAKLLGLKAIGIEIEEEYAEIAAERVRQGVLPFTKEEGDTVPDERLL